MSMVTAERHRKISAQFMRHAEEEFAKGDLLQASEKAWGAGSHYINAIARDRGWGLGSHVRLVNNAERLIKKDPGQARRRGTLLRSVQSLHANFYNEFLSEETVRGGIEDAKELISALEELSRKA